MYIPGDFSVSSEQQLLSFIDEFSFASLIDNTLECTLLPLLQRREEGKILLEGHLARKNPQSNSLDGREVLVLFQGPHAYISPSWYHNAPAVPTWNYVVVEARGSLHALNDDDTRSILTSSILKFDPELLDKKDILPDTLVDKLLPKITGLQVRVDSIAGKFKLNQNKSCEDQRLTLAELSQQSDHNARALAEYWLAVSRDKSENC